MRKVPDLEQMRRSGNEVLRFMEHMVGKSLKFIKPLQQSVSNRLDVTMQEKQLKELLTNLSSSKGKLSKATRDSPYRPLLQFLCHSGCRPNEALKIVRPELPAALSTIAHRPPDELDKNTL